MPSAFGAEGRNGLLRVRAAHESEGRGMCLGLSLLCETEEESGYRPMYQFIVYNTYKTPP